MSHERIILTALICALICTLLIMSFVSFQWTNVEETNVEEKPKIYVKEKPYLEIRKESGYNILCSNLKNTNNWELDGSVMVAIMVNQQVLSCALADLKGLNKPEIDDILEDYNIVVSTRDSQLIAVTSSSEGGRKGR